MNDLITIEQDPPQPIADRIAKSELAHINSELSRRVQFHETHFDTFWGSECTPDQILASMGTKAAFWLDCAGENVAHVARLAARAGKELTDFLPLGKWQPRRAFVVAEDGTVTLAPPADGFDAWGNPIPEPPNPEPPTE